MPFLRNLGRLIRKQWKAALGTFFGTLIPKICRWFAEEWAGNHIVDWIDEKVRQMNFGVISAVWNWMAIHPLQVVAYTTCGLVTFFAIETRFRETKFRDDSQPPTAERESPPPSDTKKAEFSERLHSAFLTTGKDGESKIRIDTAENPNGILISVTQSMDPDKGFPCNIMLVDLKRIQAGVPSATAELHNVDGSFRYGRVFLDLASAQKNLFFNAPGLWWLVSTTGPQIRYAWGERREHGSIDVRQGEWLASVEIEVNDLLFARDIRFSWDGSKLLGYPLKVDI